MRQPLLILSPFVWGPPDCRGDVAFPPSHSWGSPNIGGQNQNWLPHPNLLRGLQEGGNATSPLHSRGSPDKGGQNQKWLPRPYLLMAQKRAEMLRHPCILGGPHTKGEKIRIATPPLHSPGSPNKGGQNQKWLPHPNLLGGPHEGQNATSPLHSRGSPYKRGENQNWLRHTYLLKGPQAAGNAMGESLHCARTARYF